MGLSSAKHRCFTRRCSRMVKEQKARLYILRQCATIGARSWLFSVVFAGSFQLLQAGFSGPLSAELPLRKANGSGNNGILTQEQAQMASFGLLKEFI
ncbi:hypothetical protein EJ110_NYTH30566 [Nymphaea thermarum]|nr:hypothetical protein EJ110_NYTH30566 [Nymphaea thermarum]